MGLLRRCALAALLVTLALSWAPYALAQSGPAPGYDDPYAYAVDYAQDEAAHAAKDPAGWAEGRTSPEGVAREAEHGAWLTCWTAHEATGTNAGGVCDAYYRPAQAAQPQQPPKEPEPPAKPPASDLVDGTLGLAGTALDAIATSVEDPWRLPEQLARVAGAAAGFVDGAAAWLLGQVHDALDLAAEALGLGADLVAAGAQGAAVGALGVAAGVSQDVVEVVASAADAVKDSAHSAGSAVAQAVDRAVAAVQGLFGAGQGDGASPPAAPELSDAVDEEGLLDGVQRLLGPVA